MAPRSRLNARELPDFEASLSDIPWFLNLGKAHPRDHEVGVVRIHSFDEWLGPERGYGYWFARYPAVVRERLLAAHAGRNSELNSVWERIEGRVILAASRNVPGAGEGDAYHGPTYCVYQAGYNAALIGWHVLLGQAVPETIAEHWAWLTAGHWPCDYAEEPPGCGDETRVGGPPGKLVVF